MVDDTVAPPPPPEEEPKPAPTAPTFANMDESEAKVIISGLMHGFRRWPAGRHEDLQDMAPLNVLYLGSLLAQHENRTAALEFRVDRALKHEVREHLEALERERTQRVRKPWYVRLARRVLEVAGEEGAADGDRY